MLGTLITGAQSFGELLHRGLLRILSPLLVPPVPFEPQVPGVADAMALSL